MEASFHGNSRCGGHTLIRDLFLWSHSDSENLVTFADVTNFLLEKASSFARTNLMNQRTHYLTLRASMRLT